MDFSIVSKDVKGPSKFQNKKCKYQLIRNKTKTFYIPPKWKKKGTPFGQHDSGDQLINKKGVIEFTEEAV